MWWGGGGGWGGVFFFNDTATTEIYTLSLHDALPICEARVMLCACVSAVSTSVKVESNSAVVRVAVVSSVMLNEAFCATGTSLAAVTCSETVNCPVTLLLYRKLSAIVTVLPDWEGV